MDTNLDFQSNYARIAKRAWPFSSYHAHLSRRPTSLRRADVLAWFDGPAGFAAAHHAPVDKPALEPLAPDDFD